MGESSAPDAPLPVAPEGSGNPAGKARKAKRFAPRPWVRAIHRDAGYLAVGLTLVYALSGIAVNHLTDWKDGDASFRSYQRTVEWGAGSLSKTEDDASLARRVLDRLAIRTAPRETFREGEDELEILFDKRSLHVNLATGTVVDEGQEPRFFLRMANWLHLNRGKKAWTYVADTYAAGLLLLAVSGLVMIPGRKGVFGRGAVFVALGVAVPVLYVTLSGGP